VTFEYGDGRPVALKTVLISSQHQPGIDIETLLKPDLREHVIHPLLPTQFAEDRYQLLANPTGSFELGGPHADTGLTGRKIIVDTYGGSARHGGGAFSGKDPSKVDRSGAYAARWVAKHVVAAGAAQRCEIQVAYAIGVARPVSIMVDTFGTGRPQENREDGRRHLRSPPGGDHHRPRPLSADIPAYRGIRSLRPAGEGVLLGARESFGRGEAVPRPVVARVWLDVAAIGRPFDYLVPPAFVDHVRIGTLVRVPLNGRRAGGWVVELADGTDTVKPLKPVAKVTGWGPAPDVIDLAHWASWRWAGPMASFLRAASPDRAVTATPTFSGAWVPPQPEAVRKHLVCRQAPAADPFPLVLDAARRGDALVLVPSVAGAATMATRLRQAGCEVALMPYDWARAAAGGCTVVGTRTAAWAPRPRLDSVVVVDEHDETYQGERAPTWNGRDVAVERARRAGVPWLLISPCPSLEALGWAPSQYPSRDEERLGWPVVEVIDRRPEPPGSGLYSARLVALLRGGGRVVCVLNRKGRARLLACAACAELARCQSCGAAMMQGEGELVCGRCPMRRPVVCAVCGNGSLKVLRVGVTRARQELEILAGRTVVEVTGDTRGSAPHGDVVLVGTEAVLHRSDIADVVAFLDFDQELLAPRYRAAEEAFALLARAARLVGGRRGGGRILVQTRLPDHETIDAAVSADPSRLALVESARRAALRFPPERKGDGEPGSQEHRAPDYQWGTIGAPSRIAANRGGWRHTGSGCSGIPFCANRRRP